MQYLPYDPNRRMQGGRVQVQVQGRAQAQVRGQARGQVRVQAQAQARGRAQESRQELLEQVRGRCYLERQGYPAREGRQGRMSCPSREMSVGPCSGVWSWSDQSAF